MKLKLLRLWQDITVLVSDLSTCERLKVGCLLVSLDGERLLAFGYNGGIRGGDNIPLVDTPGIDFWVHAEANALVKTRPVERFVAFCSVSPCFNCAQLLINAGVEMVYYEVPYRDPAGADLLRSRNLLTKLEVPDAC